jgi:hypothetical protein
LLDSTPVAQCSRRLGLALFVIQGTVDAGLTDVFSNFSPYPLPPSVNVLLLDSLNTNMENQSFVHSQTMKFLKSAKPGSPMAIFTMGQQLRFIQGFTADPALLMAALNSKKNNEVEQSALIKGQGEADAQKNLLAQMRAGGRLRLRSRS